MLHCVRVRADVRRRLPDPGSRQPSAEGTSRVNALSEQILSELRHLLSGMSDGGSVGPSVYDTARTLQFHGNVTGRQDAYAWLIAQQQADGGWGSADFPLFRHGVPPLRQLFESQLHSLNAH